MSVWGQKRTCSFDDVVCERQYLGRKVDAERLGGSQVDDQFELCRLHNGQIGRFLSLEDPRGVDPDLAIRAGKVLAIAEKTAGSRVRTPIVNCRNPVTRNQCDDLLTAAEVIASNTDDK